MRPETDATIAPADRHRRQGDATTGDTAEKVDTLRFDLMHSAIYHDLRARWFGRLYRLSLYVVVVLGSGAVAALAQNWPLLAQIAGVLVTLISAAHLVFDWANVHRCHTDLKCEFYDLLADLEAGHDAQAIKARLPLLWAKEPAEHIQTANRAHNRAGQSLYGDDFNKV